MEKAQRERYSAIASEILQQAPDAPVEAVIWRRTLLLGIQDAIAGDSEAIEWLGSHDCREAIRLAGLPLERTLDILVDRGLVKLGKAA